VFTARYALSPYIKQIRFVFKGLIYQPTYALNKTDLQTSIKLLHVSATECHRQGVIQNKAVQGQHHIGIMSPFQFYIFS
jgi:hypothetical protein